MPGATPATVIVVAHNSAHHIGETLDALLSDPEGPAEVIVVDNGSSDTTAEVVAQRPTVQLHARQTNDGFGAAANAGVELATQTVVAVINDDVQVSPGWLPPLVDALDADGIGAASATVALTDDPGSFNTSGGAVTVSGMAWITDLGQPIPTDEVESVPIPFPSGAAFAMRRAIWDRLGGFREDFFLYHEDTDLGWRLRMRGLHSVRVPASRVMHRYEFARNPGKLWLLERNRLRMVLTNYRRSTVLLLAPVLVLHELGTLVVSIRDRWFLAKMRSWRTGALGGEGRRRYRSIQAERVVGDAEILAERTGAVASIPIPEVRVPLGTGIVDRLTRAYVGVVIPLVRFLDRRRGL
ncbi:MAG: glycosyltransferase family 2 protein [Acidimicrobiia bacterium]